MSDWNQERNDYAAGWLEAEQDELDRIEQANHDLGLVERRPLTRAEYCTRLGQERAEAENAYPEHQWWHWT